MATKTKSPKIKTAQLKHFHSKAFRKRHILTFSSFMMVILLGFGMYYQIQQSVKQQSINTSEYIADLLVNDSNTMVDVTSDSGFGLKVNSTKYSVSARDRDTGNVFTGVDIINNQTFNNLRIAKSLLYSAQTGGINIDYLADVAIVDQNLETVQQIALLKVYPSIALAKKESVFLKLANRDFIRTDWSRSYKIGTKDVTDQFRTYTTIHKDHPLIIGVDMTDEPRLNDELFGIAETINFDFPNGQKPNNIINQQKTNPTSLINQKAYAASSKELSPQKNGALNSPAVVKIYNFYCKDLEFNGGTISLKDYCVYALGSGFFISSDGFIATNGHVVYSSPKDLIISYAIEQSVKGNKQPFKALVEKQTTITEDKVSQLGTDLATVAEYYVDELYKLPDNMFVEKLGSTTNLVVAYGKNSIKPQDLAETTKKRETFTPEVGVKNAKLIDIDFKAAETFSKLKASDQAIIKIDGSGYPVLNLGDISTVSSGSEMVIIGYPGKANLNELVDTTENIATLTSGKVSSIKNAGQTEYKLIETDTTIGHGNSGGPAFNNKGEVIGIATYTVDGSGDGSGIYNYVRDINELKTLVKKSNIKINSASRSNDIWYQAIDQYFNSRYSKSLKTFESLKQIYPEHPLVEEFIAKAKTNIGEGNDVKDTNFVLIGLLIGVGIAGGFVAAYLIYRHKHHHNVYKATANQGLSVPTAKGDQHIVVNYELNPINIVEHSLDTIGKPAPESIVDAVKSDYENSSQKLNNNSESQSIQKK